MDEKDLINEDFEEFIPTDDENVLPDTLEELIAEADDEELPETVDEIITEEKQNKKKSGKFVDALMLVVALVCAGVFIYSAYVLVNNLVIEPYKAKAESQSMHPAVSFQAPDKDGVWKVKDDIKDEVDENGVLLSMQSALETNEDVIGWITLTNTAINYPVVRSPYKNNNEYYLRRGLDKKYLSRGTLFLDNSIEVTNEITDNKNYVIYGHNMKNGTMFHDLLKYSDLEFYRENPIMEFDTLYQSGKWVVYSVMKCNVNQALDKVFEYYDTSFANDEEFEKFIEETMSRSIIDTGIDVNKDDTVLTLQTCSYEYKYIRTVVVARRIRENEKEINVSQAKKAKNPVMPSYWKKDW